MTPTPQEPEVGLTAQGDMPSILTLAHLSHICFCPFPTSVLHTHTPEKTAHYKDKDSNLFDDRALFSRNPNEHLIGSFQYTLRNAALIQNGKARGNAGGFS